VLLGVVWWQETQEREQGQAPLHRSRREHLPGGAASVWRCGYSLYGQHRNTRILRYHNGQRRVLCAGVRRRMLFVPQGRRLPRGLWIARRLRSVRIVPRWDDLRHGGRLEHVHPHGDCDGIEPSETRRGSGWDSPQPDPRFAKRCKLVS
jgi:hypothetical protein